MMYTMLRRTSKVVFFVFCVTKISSRHIAFDGFLAFPNAPCQLPGEATSGA